MTLEEKLSKRLNAAKFRLINHKIYKNSPVSPSSISFYHQNYSSHVENWPHNPLLKIMSHLNPLHTIADLGCGSALIASKMHNTKVYSYDKYPANNSIIKCDIKRVPLPNCSVDIIVFCLSLMKNDVVCFIREGSRILKMGGRMYIAEVRSRVDVDYFVEGVCKVGFVLEWVDRKCDVFFVCEFKKIRECGSKVEPIIMKDSEYKKR